MGTAMITFMFWCFEPLTFVVRRNQGQLESATSLLLHDLTNKVNLNEEADKADASYDHAVLQFLLALLKGQQSKRQRLLRTLAGRGRRLARGSVLLGRPGPLGGGQNTSAGGGRSGKMAGRRCRGADSQTSLGGISPGY